MLRVTGGIGQVYGADVAVLSPGLRTHAREHARGLVRVGLSIGGGAAHLSDDEIDARHLRAVAVRVGRLRVAETDVESNGSPAATRSVPPVSAERRPRPPPRRAR